MFEWPVQFSEVLKCAMRWQITVVHHKATVSVYHQCMAVEFLAVLSVSTFNLIDENNHVHAAVINVKRLWTWDLSTRRLMEFWVRKQSLVSVAEPAQSLAPLLKPPHSAHCHLEPWCGQPQMWVLLELPQLSSSGMCWVVLEGSALGAAHEGVFSPET